MVPGGARSPPGSPERERFWFRPGTGRTVRCRRTAGSRSSAARRGRAPRSDGTPGDWYLHLFAPEQPDLNWTHPDVWAEHEDVLRFWFDRGVAGVRIDSAALLVKDPELPRRARRDRPASTRSSTATSCTRSTAAGARSPTAMPSRACSSARSGCPTPNGSRATCARTSCTPRSTSTSSRAPGSRRRCARRSSPRLPRTLRSDAPATWVLSNHDVTRPVTRYGRADTSFAFESKRRGTPTDLERGTRRPAPRRCSRWRCPARCTSTRARSSACPRSRTSRPSGARIRCGTAPAASIPAATAAGFRCRGRGRVRRTASAGRRGRPWLDQPDDWAPLTVEAQAESGTSMLALYRAGLRFRRAAPWGDDAGCAGFPSRESVLAFARGERLRLHRQFRP